MEPEAHPFAEVFYVLDGAGEFAVGGRPHPCAAGDVVAVPAGVEHAITDGPAPLTLYGIGVGADLLARDPDALPRDRAGVVAGSRALAGQVRTGVRRMLCEQADPGPGGRALVVGLALQLVAAVARAAALSRPGAGGAGREAVGRFLDDLDRRFHEPVRIDRAADELGLSRRSFTRLFREAAGCPYAEYVERVRVRHACRLLRDPARGIAPVAFQCGYEDLSAFYRAFKRQTGLSPGRWRAGEPEPA
jgi:AraC family L-rhamnose operon regulatory protein RhaS